MDERSVSIAKKWAALEASKCSICAKFHCSKDHAVCIRCNKINNHTAISGECTRDERTIKRHAYDF